jgi:hypothetical protein
MPFRRLRFAHLLLALLTLGLLVRLVYIGGQAATDPFFARPVADGAYYVEWGQALAHGFASPGGGHPKDHLGAFYLAPLYAFTLAGFFKVFGQNFGLLFYFQHLAIVAAAGLFALAMRRLVSPAAGLAAAILVMAYHPTIFFASRPLGEPLALALLAGSLYAGTRGSRPADAVCGLLSGIAALARPNLVLVPLVWCALRLFERRAWHAAALLAGLVLAVAPITLHNLDASGHPVAVSSNGGVTLYHGNAPGAIGIAHYSPGLSSGLPGQRPAATRLASFFAGRELDAVEADRYWGREAVRARLADPLDTAVLLGRRVGLVLSSVELTLDYAPALDAAPWRWLAPIPFALVLGLAVGGLLARGVRGTGGAVVWSAVAACALTPLAFYVSSRYRLPFATLLCLPAGAGLAALFDRDLPARRRGVAALGLAVTASLSWLIPVGEARAASEATALARRAAAAMEAGDGTAARTDLDRALELDPDSLVALRGMQDLLQQTGKGSEFDRYMQRALEVHPRSLAERWRSTVLESVARGDLAGALRSFESAAAQGVDLDPDLRARIEAAVEAQPQRRAESAG